MEQRISLERMEEAVSLFGSFDENIRILENEFHVSVVNREEQLIITGEPEDTMLAEKAIEALLRLISRGENVGEQHVRYVIGLCRSGQLDRIDELKIVYRGQDVEAVAALLPATRHYLQPCSGLNIAETVAYILAHPRWRLSLQTHKLIDIQ